MTRRPAKEYTTKAIHMVVVICACLAVSSAGAQEIPAPRSPASTAGRTATLLFMSTGSLQTLPAGEAELRAAGEAALHGAVEASGAVCASPDLVEALQIRNRVRSSLVITRRLLDDLSAETGADYLLVVQLMFDKHAILAAGRLIDTHNGLLLNADILDPETWAGTDWPAAIERGVGKLVSGLDTKRHGVEGVPFVVLPVQARGIAIRDAITATHTVLHTVLAGSEQAVIDPGVLNHLLIESGYDPRKVDFAGMTVLVDSLGAELMLKTEIISYDTQTGSSVSVIDESSTEVQSVLPSFTYIARITDLKSGNLLGCANLYHEHRPVYGWFGTVKIKTSRSILGEAAKELWDQLGPHTEELHDHAKGATRVDRDMATGEHRAERGDGRG